MKYCTILLLGLILSVPVFGAISRIYDFEADRDAGIKIQAARVDAELDQLVGQVNKQAPAQPTAPSSPSIGDLWVDTSTNPPTLKVWDGTAWVAVTSTGAGPSNIQTDIGFYLDADSVQEVIDGGVATSPLITSFIFGSQVGQGDPFRFSDAPTNTFQFGKDNITTPAKFGDNAMNFNDTDMAMVVPGTVDNFHRIDFTSSGSLSLWYKGTATSVTLLESASRHFKLAINGSGQPVASFTEQDTTVHSATAASAINDDAYHNVIVTWVVNTGTASDSINVYVDNSTTGSTSGVDISIDNGSSIVAGNGSVILGSGIITDGDSAYEATVLPASASPVWTKTASGTPTETITNGILKIDTTTGSTDSEWYKIDGGANWTVAANPGYWAEIRLRVLDDNGGLGACLVQAADGSRSSTIYVREDHVAFRRADDIEHRFELTPNEFHTIKVRSSGAGGDDWTYFYIDGIAVFVATRTTTTTDRIAFGDLSSVAGENIVAEIDYVRFYQTDPQGAQYGEECNGMIDSFVVYPDKVITAAERSSLQSNSGKGMISLIDGNQIQNIENAHPAIADLIDEWDFEQRLMQQMTGYVAGASFDLSQNVDFHTKKRVIPVITIEKVSYANANSVTAQYVNRDSWNFFVDSTGAGAVGVAFTWTAQTASHIKFRDITDTEFTWVKGTPILDGSGNETGEYSTDEETISMSNVTVANDINGNPTRLYQFTSADGNTLVFIPMDNEETIVDELFDDPEEHVAKQAKEVVKKKMGTAAYNAHQDDLRALKINQKELAKIRKENAEKDKDEKVQIEERPNVVPDPVKKHKDKYSVVE